MSSGLHLTRDTQDLIKNIGESRSKQEEDNLIRKDIEKLKKKIQEKPYEKMTSSKEIREIAIRAIYADMLGHDVSFVHFFLINMTQCKTNLNVKRAGYLACWLLLGEDSDLKIMLVASLQKDLQSGSAYEILIALNSLNKLMNPSNINNLVNDVLPHLGHTNPLIKKKAFCLLQKMVKINSKCIPNWEQKLREGLSDREPSVTSVCLNLYYEDALQNPEKHREVLKPLVSILNNILDVKLPRDYDFQRIPAPWAQIRLMQLIGIICGNNAKLSDEVYTVIEKALRRSDDTMTDVAYAVTFQAIKTICKLYPNQSLLEKASKTVGKFFIAQPPNSKINKINLYYMGIDSMRSLVNINAKYATKHQVHIVDCLQHPDESIRRPTLDLLYKTTTSGNLDVVMDKMLAYLKSTTEERFKYDLVQKVYELNERLAPSPDWFVQKTNIIFQYGSECIDDAMLSRTIKIIEENLEMDQSGEFGSLLLGHYYDLLDKSISPQLVKLISWIFAEVGYRVYASDLVSLGQLASAILSLSRLKSGESPTTKNWIISALGKISSCPGFESAEVDEFFNEMKQSVNLELRERAFEYKTNSNGIQSLAHIQNYDVNLAFLRDTIVNAIESGMPKYDASKLTMSLVVSKPDTAKDELPTQHREVKIVPEDKADEQEPKLTVRKGWIKKPGDDSGSKVPEPVKIPQGLGDNKKEQEKDTEKVDKRLKAANKLFGPVEDTNVLGSGKQTQKKPTFLKPAAKNKEGATPTQTPKTNTTTDGTSNMGGQNPKTPAQDEDLLGLDLGGSPTTPKPSNQQSGGELNLLDDITPGGGSQATTPSQTTPNQPPKSTKFVKPAFKAPTPKLEKALTPFPISESKYEEYWTQFSIERKENLKNTAVRTQTEFNQMVKTIGFHITSTIDTDNICASKFQDKIVLFYGKFKINGDVEAVFNGNDKEAVDFAVDSLRKYCGR